MLGFVFLSKLCRVIERMLALGIFFYFPTLFYKVLSFFFILFYSFNLVNKIKTKLVCIVCAAYIGRSSRTFSKCKDLFYFKKYSFLDINAKKIFYIHYLVKNKSLFRKKLEFYIIFLRNKPLFLINKISETPHNVSIIFYVYLY